MSLMRSLVMLMLMVLFSSSVCADIYKCADAQGRIVYGDKPCGDNATLVTPRVSPGPATSGPQSAAQRMEKTRRLLNAMDADRRAEKQQKADAKAEKELRTKNCKQAKFRYNRVIQASRLMRLDDEGNRVVLNDEERAASTRRAREDMEQWCS